MQICIPYYFHLDRLNETMANIDRLSAFIKENISNPLINFLFPAICGVCENPLEQDEKIICHNCLNTLKPLEEKYIYSLLEEIQNPKFDTLIVLFEFDKVFQALIHLLKYQRFLSIADFFAQEISHKVNNSYELILGVPLNRIRLRERGYNQSALIAGHLAKLKQTNYSERILNRQINTPSQTKLNRVGRIKNMQGAFRCEEQLKDQSILLVDDVITTGSTVNSCAGVLKEAGASRVDVVSLATPVGFFQQNLEREKTGSEVFNKGA